MLELELFNRHGNNVLVMSTSDWETFKETFKAKYPEVYEDMKKNMNFNLTPVTIFPEGD